MRRINNLVFWQQCLSIHQSALLRSLAASSGAKVTLVVEEGVRGGRRELGWHSPIFGSATVIIGPSSQEQAELLSRDPASTAHVFPGSRGGGQLAWRAFCRGFSSNACIGIYSEAQKDMGLKGFLRTMRGRYHALRFRDRVDFILGIATLGVRWFRNTGYFPETIFPFGYFVETPALQNDDPPQEALPHDSFNLVFVGQLINRKGWDILLHALCDLDDQNWRLHVVGDGVDREKFARLCAKLGLNNSVHFCGKLPNAQALSLIWKSDLLVLPSRWDGWGAVVNEALMCGVPVVCSNRCGAADLLDGSERGEVFRSGDVLALRSALARRIAQGKAHTVTREKIREWSQCISGESAADYFMEIIGASIIRGNKPIAPWFA